jgi:hypothetical protein
LCSSESGTIADCKLILSFSLPPDNRSAREGSPRRYQDERAARRSGRGTPALSPADFQNFIAEETEKWAKVIKIAGIKAE